jgi:hypothetical protein
LVELRVKSAAEHVACVPRIEGCAANVRPEGFFLGSDERDHEKVHTVRKAIGDFLASLDAAF